MVKGQFRKGPAGLDSSFKNREFIRFKSFRCQSREKSRGFRCPFAGFEHHPVACCNGARNRREAKENRKIPGRNHPHYPQRLRHNPGSSGHQVKRDRTLPDPHPARQIADLIFDVSQGDGDVVVGRFKSGSLSEIL